MKALNLTPAHFKRIGRDINGHPLYFVSIESFVTITPDILDLTSAFEWFNNIRKGTGLVINRRKNLGLGFILQSYSLQHDCNWLNSEINIKLNLRDKADQIQLHRKPTEYEIKMGYGATHYKCFDRAYVTKYNGDFKMFVVCPYDGLRYYY